MRLFKYRWVPLLFIIILTFTGCSSYRVNNAQIKKGTFDISKWDYINGGNIKLDGEWEFYWNRLLVYGDFQAIKPDIYANIPNTWSKYKINGKKMPGLGYATYRLHVKTDLPVNTQLGLGIHTFSSAYNMYINDKLVASNGRVADKASEEMGEYKPQIAFFNTPASDFDIIIQVSNFQYNRGGFWNSLYLGNVQGIVYFHDIAVVKEIFLIGALIIISIFYFATYILQKEFKYSLYFSILCMFIVISRDMVDQFFITRIIPQISLKIVIYIWYSAITGAIIFLILFVNELFKSKVSTCITKICLACAGVYQIIQTVTPPTFYSRFADMSNSIAVGGFIVTVVIVAIGIKKRYMGAWLNIIGIFIVLMAYIHDILYYTNRINNGFGEVLHVGLFIYMLLQMVIQAQRIRVFHEQKKVAELSFLHAQIKPHFMYNAMNTFISISRYDMEKARELLINFSNYLRRSFDIKDLRQNVPLKNEIELSKAYIEIQKARFEERLEVNFEVCEDPEVKIPILVLQPIIENAINHGVLPKPEGGHIDISILNDRKQLLFKVKDDGVGMDLKKTGILLKHEFGSGVGLSNIDNRLKKLYGKGLQINSTPGIGTEVTWCIPINRREKK